MLGNMDAKTIRHVTPLVVENNKMLSYRREAALQGALLFSPKVEDWNWETIFYTHYRSIIKSVKFGEKNTK